MTAHPAETGVAAFFRDLGFQVSRVRRSAAPTPDLLVRGDRLDYLVEVKAFGPPDTWTAELASTGSVITEVEHATTGPISRRLANAEKQLTSFDPSIARLRILAVEIDARWPELLEQLYTSLYGARMGLRKAGDRLLPVLYVDTPQFARFPGITAVVAFVGNDGRMFLNEQSEQYAEIQQSRLVQEVREGVFDARAEIEAGEALEFPREWRTLTEEEKQARMLSEQGVRLLRFTAHSAATLVHAPR
jgi:hypothetical protein